MAKKNFSKKKILSKKINDSFTLEEFKILLIAKGKETWHDFILGKCLTNYSKLTKESDYESRLTNEMKTDDKDLFNVDLGEKGIW